MVLKLLRVIAVIAVALLVGAAVFVYSGLYNIAADEPHWRVTERVMETLRMRSVAARSQDLAVPPLDDPQFVRNGASQYAEMCVSCHLAPGLADTPTRQGLYPKPPKFAERNIDPREAFWIVKHGIKMSGMPAWGASHDDRTLWSIVAFLQQLPALTPQQYREIVATAPPDEAMSATPGEKGHGREQGGHDETMHQPQK